MKKILFSAALITLIAAGCNNNQSSYQGSMANPRNGSYYSGSAPSQNNSNGNSIATPQPELKITKLSPSSGLVNTTVTITGQGFAKTGNLVMFGKAGTSHHPDGRADNVIAKSDSADSITLTFTVPASGPSGILCDKSNHCIGISAMLRQAGKYPVYVSNGSKVSNALTFTITK